MYTVTMYPTWGARLRTGPHDGGRVLGKFSSREEAQKAAREEEWRCTYPSGRGEYAVIEETEAVDA